MRAKSTTAALLVCTCACLASTATLCDEAQELRQFSLRCDVIEHYVVGDKAKSNKGKVDKQKVLQFTFEIRGSKGRYFDWQTGTWSRIALVTDNAYTLDAFALNSNSMGASIDRRTGQYENDSTSGGATLSVRGRCTEIPLMTPPSAKF